MSGLHIIFEKYFGIESYFEKVDLLSTSVSQETLGQKMSIDNEEGRVLQQELQNFKFDILNITAKEANWLLKLMVLIGLLRVQQTDKAHRTRIPQKLMQLLNQIVVQVTPYLDILPKIAAEEITLAEVEHYALKMMHKEQSRKSKQRRATKYLDNL